MQTLSNEFHPVLLSLHCITVITTTTRGPQHPAFRMNGFTNARDGRPQQLQARAVPNASLSDGRSSLLLAQRRRAFDVYGLADSGQIGGGKPEPARC